MACNHEQVKCTNGVFYCLKCGAEIANPFAVKQPAAGAEKPAEGPKKPVKRRTKKEAE